MSRLKRKNCKENTNKCKQEKKNLYYLFVKNAMKYEDHQALKRVEYGEYILEDNGIRIETQQPKQPSDSKQWKNDPRGLDSSSHFFHLCLVLHVFCSHHLAHDQNKNHDINL